MMRALTLALAVLSLAAAAHAAPTGVLNDTGQTECVTAGLVAGPCDATNAGDSAMLPRQDGRFGRDAAAAIIKKVGDGVGAFDFTRVCQNGTLDCLGPLNVTDTPADTDWACTKDNVTNLIWALEVDPLSVKQGGGPWTPYARIERPAAANAANRCGYNTGWRLPSRRELLSFIVIRAGNPLVDVNFFPLYVFGSFQLFWSNDPLAADPENNAWAMDVGGGNLTIIQHNFIATALLVRSGD